MESWFEFIFYFVAWVSISVFIVFEFGLDSDSSIQISGAIIIVVLILLSFIDQPTVTVNEYPIIEISDTFVIYEIDGVKYSEELDKDDVKMGDSNKVVITETTFDELKFINAISINVPNSETKIYFKLGE